VGTRLTTGAQVCLLIFSLLACAVVFHSERPRELTKAEIEEARGKRLKASQQLRSEREAMSTRIQLEMDRQSTGAEVCVQCV
jgi:hypothetical protein